MRQPELPLDRLHRPVDVAVSPLTRLDLADDVANRADGRAGADRPEAGLLGAPALGRPAYPELVAILPGIGAALSAVDVDVEAAGHRHEVAFRPAREADTVEADPGIADLAPCRRDETMAVRIIGRQRPIGRERVARLDEATFDPLRGRIAEQHRDEVDRVRVMLDQVG